LGQFAWRCPWAVAGAIARIVDTGGHWRAAPSLKSAEEENERGARASQGGGGGGGRRPQHGTISRVSCLRVDAPGRKSSSIDLAAGVAATIAARDMPHALAMCVVIITRELYTRPPPPHSA
jgi:hypothetical protein